MAQTLEIGLVEDIGGWGFDLNMLISELKGFKGDNIRVPINSFGGSVVEGMAIYNTLRGRSETVTTHIVGYAMSMGTIVALAGDEVTMADNGYFMIHNPWTFAAGDFADMDAQSKVLSMMTDDLAKIYSQKTGLTVSRIKKMMAEETWMNAKEAKRLGFVDKLTKGAQFNASFSSEYKEKLKNIPEGLINNQTNKHKSNMTLFEKVKAWFNEDFDTEAAAIAHMEKNDLSKVVNNAVSESDIKAEFEALKTVVSNRNDEVETIKASVEELEGVKADNETLKTEIETIKADNEALKSEVADIKAGKASVPKPKAGNPAPLDPKATKTTGSDKFQAEYEEALKKIKENSKN